MTNATGFILSSQTDTSFHSLATLTIAAAGSYTSTATVVAHAAGGSGEGNSLCELVAHTTSGGSDDKDEAEASVDNHGSVAVAFTTIPLQVTHTFSGPGTITLSCQQNALTNGGAFFFWEDASIIATQVSSLTSVREPEPSA